MQSANVGGIENLNIFITVGLSKPSRFQMRANFDAEGISSFLFAAIVVLASEEVGSALL
jgi:hypothetical protein